jgi:hypothetical protein
MLKHNLRLGSLVLACVLVLLVWLFAGALFQGKLFAFRDGADFYYPLFRFIQSQWSAGRAPLWNPYDNLGLPLAANPAASIWYPGKLIFFLPLDYDAAYKIYVLCHVLLAAAAAFRLSRHWQASVVGSGIAAISYAFGASVLYQYCNVVFLVGAAWMPVALLAADRMIAGRSARWSVGVGLVWSLMILGGDPQAAYHAALLTAVYALCHVSLIRSRAGDASLGATGFASASEDSRLTPCAGNLERHGGLKLLAAMTIATATTFSLSAIQLLPSWEFSAQSDRAITATARSLYEIPQTLRHDDARARIAAGLLCRFDDTPHHEMVYDFSLGPWRLAELVWPNCSGRQFPRHHRWLDALPEEGPIWTPSLYFGLLPLLLALGQFRLWRGERLDRWLSWMTLLAVTAGFGRFGLGWLVRQAASWFGAEHHVAQLLGDPVGGVYWLLTVVLPGYVQFRYPAKWMTVATLLLCILAARGWDRAAASDSSAARLQRCFRWLGALSLLAALIAVTIVVPIALRAVARLASAVPPDAMFGPLDTTGAAHDLFMSLLQTGVLAIIFSWIFRWPAAAWAGPLCVVLLTLDLAAANGWLVVTAPAELWHAPPKLAPAIHAEGFPPRIYRHWIWLPQAWQTAGSSARLEEALRWNRDTLAPQYHLTLGFNQVETYGTLMLADFQALVRAASVPLRPQRIGDDTGWAGSPLCDLLGVQYALVPDGTELPGWTIQDLRPLGLDSKADDLCLSRRIRPLPRAWIVHELEMLPPLGDQDPGPLRQRSAALLQLAADSDAVRRRAIVETAAPLSPAPTTLADTNAATVESCQLQAYQPQHVELTATLARPGLVILSDQFYPGWQLTVASDGHEPRPAEIVRTDRVLRGVWLPAGTHRLQYDYQPGSFRCGAILSGLAWAALLATGTVLSRRYWRSPTRQRIKNGKMEEIRSHRLNTD